MEANSAKLARPAIELHQVVKKFHTTAGEFMVLKGIDLILREHEFISIVGKSGSGKSTLLNMITGIDHPTTGEVFVGGENIYKMSESQRALWRGRNLGIVFQFFQLLPTLTLLENIILPMDYCNTYTLSERPARALELLKLVGLEAQAHKLPAAVSIGQQQSAAIARALANDPSIIIADEPTGNLDSRSADVIIHLFEDLASQGKTVAMVTHDPFLTERTNRNIVISDGELIDETVAKALPLLTHRQMLNISHRLESLTFQPGVAVINAGQSVSYFFMVASGEVEIVLKTRRRQELVLARLGPGEFFGEIELLRGGNSIASVRAGQDEPVVLKTLKHNDFIQLLADSPLTEEAISRVVQARVAEHRISDRRHRWWPL